MLTTTHILLAAATTSRPTMKKWQIALAWLGGLAPDFSVFVMVASVRLFGEGGQNIWRKPDGLYWSEPWQTFSAISNSIPLYAVGLATGLLLYRKRAELKQFAIGLMVFCGGALLHVSVDFFVHTDDAHIHFWPFSGWRFHSLVSYYQRDHHGAWVGMLEIGLGLVAVVILFRSFSSWWLRGLAILLLAPYVFSIRFMF